MDKVYATLVGGIGNQLFQAATAFAYAKEHNKELILDASEWGGSQGNHPSTYQNSIFSNFKVITEKPVNYTELKETRFNYDPLQYISGDVKLHGYFQSVKYFEKYKDDFVQLLSWPEVKTEWIEENSVAFHVRRGDYLQHHHIHFICDTKYFSDQFEKFKDNTINVFTDDKKRFMDEFYDLEKVVYMIDTDSEIKDLYLMSQHDNIVCSNSSFSWWASLLGKKKKQIIVPNIWFKNFENHDDIYRTDFTRIPV